MKKLNDKDIKKIFTKIKDIMIENKDLLFKLDSIMGDGDLGITMSNGFIEVEKDILNYNEPKIGKIFMKAGMVLAEASPSTMGTLMADGLLKAGMCIQDKIEVDLRDLTLFFSEFVNRIMVTGKAKCGEKTIVDSLYPAARALEDSLKANKNYKDSFKSAYEEAKMGLQSTKKMLSMHGRAKWFGEKSIGKEDPGAAAGVLLLKAFYEYFKGLDNIS